MERIIWKIEISIVAGIDQIPNILPVNEWKSVRAKKLQ